jgi:hypothetical protein
MMAYSTYRTIGMIAVIIMVMEGSRHNRKEEETDYEE